VLLFSVFVISFFEAGIFLRLKRQKDASFFARTRVRQPAWRPQTSAVCTVAGYIRMGVLEDMEF
jgi:hypothetical protein